jgi:hypothetical protein
MYKLGMNTKHKIITVLLTSYFSLLTFLHAQNVKDSSLFVPMIKISYAAQWPGRDMYKRFGFSSAIALNFSVKTKHNLFFGIDGGFIFGNNIKENGILDSLKTSSGFIINGNGNAATVRLFERGYTLSVHIGKLFNILSNNKNSGLLIYAGPTYLQHKIRIDDIGHETPELSKEYLKGYDRLTSGFGFHEFIGYMYLGNKRMLNFFFGIDCTQAFTKSQRSYDFDLMKADTQKRFDMLSGFRVGWILPLYKGTPQEFYYK